MTDAVPMQEVLLVLSLARSGRLTKTTDWSTDGFASAVWNGFLSKDDDMKLTEKGAQFLAKFEFLLPKGSPR